ncbi:MAG: oligosaccharide flippase family protein [Chloroflexi bacterium]|nr:oligosaccharide flippase family protein [Chloroflexota bacterium]
MSTAESPGSPAPGSGNNDDIAARAVSGSAYSAAASLITWTLGAVRLVLLMRLLFPSDFGVYTQAFLFLRIASQLSNFGFNRALIHRKEISESILATYFTLRVLFLGGALLLLALLTPAISQNYPDMPQLGAVVLVLIALEPLHLLNNVQTTILSKQLEFRRLALANIAASIAMTVLAPAAAWLGLGVWSLVIEHVTGYVARTPVLWTSAKRWRPHFGLNRSIARWFLHFGSRLWISVNLVFVLDRFDDFWIGRQLGKTQLGYYSRAYEAARYPRRLVANPLLDVFFPTLARLQDDRARLSRAFFRVTSVMVRFGGWVSLIAVLAAPELVLLLFGERWLPMTRAFQFMVIYTLLDPLALSASNLLTAIGYPGIVSRTRIVQFIIFVPAVILLGTVAGIEGVALAADLMVLVGAIILFVYSRKYTDYSSKALWLWPIVAVLVTSACMIVLQLLWQGVSPILSLLLKIMLISLFYGGILWLTEREQLRNGFQMLWGMLAPRLSRLRKSGNSL